MSSSPWPDSPTNTFDDLNTGPATTTSTTGAVYWGGSTTKAINGRGIYLVTMMSTFRVSVANIFASFQLAKSTDGITFAAVDPSAGTWFDFKFTDTNNHAVTAAFFYSKTTHVTEYLEINWKISAAGTLTQEGASSGKSTAIRVHRIPTWPT